MPVASEFVLDQGGRERHGIENCQHYPKAILTQSHFLPRHYISRLSTDPNVLPKNEYQTRRTKDNKPDYRVHIDLRHNNKPGTKIYGTISILPSMLLP